MIITLSQVQDLIADKFSNVDLKYNKFGYLVASVKGHRPTCNYSIRFFEKQDSYCAEKFVGHHVLFLGYDKNNGSCEGGSYYAICGIDNISDEIIKHILRYCIGAKRRMVEQLTLF